MPALEVIAIAGSAAIVAAESAAKNKSDEMVAEPSAGPVRVERSAPTSIPVAGVDISGTYVSEITQRGGRTTFYPPQLRMEIHLRQDGNTITATDNSGRIKINGTREGSTIRFYVVRGNEIEGFWEIGADASRLQGRWFTNGGGGNEGKWDLVRSGQSPLVKDSVDQANGGQPAAAPVTSLPSTTVSVGEPVVPDLSGTYISRITNDHHWYFGKRQENLILHVEHRGDQVTAIDSTNFLQVDGTIQDGKVEFEIFGGESASYSFGNTVYGEWIVSDSGYLEGSWRAAGHDAQGDWDIRKIGEEKVELYTIDTGLERPFNLDQAVDLFDLVFQPSDKRNVVLYLHGRGQDFETDFEPAMIPFVEDYSDTVFVIVRWLSWGDSSIRPYQHAIDSAYGVSQIISDLDEYKSTHPERVGDRNITLMAHSMGNIPVKVFLERFYQPEDLSASLFDSVILHAADVPWEGHREWLEKVDFADNVYVLKHRGDLVLSVSNLLFRADEEQSGPRLGSGVGVDPETQELSGNARYIDLTDLNSSLHRHFNLPSNPEAVELFRRLLNGQPVDYPAPEIGLASQPAQPRVLVLRSGDPTAASRK